LSGVAETETSYIPELTAHIPSSDVYLKLKLRQIEVARDLLATASEWPANEFKDRIRDVVDLLSELIAEDDPRELQLRH
jgi:hypothetical protein